MIATGGSVRVAIEELLKAGVKEENITFINLISYIGAIRPLLELYPKIKMITACIDPELTESKYIAPGLGDFGCRYLIKNNYQKDILELIDYIKEK